MTEAPAAPQRVLHVAEFLRGGIATYLNELLPYQAEHFGPGHVGLVFPDDHADVLSDEVKAQVDLFPYRRTGRDVRSLARLRREYRRRIRSFHPDVVHLHSTFAGVVGRIAAPRAAHPLVYCAHGWAFARESAGWKLRTVAAVERRLQSRSDAVIAITEHEHDLAASHGLRLDDLTVVRYGMAPERALAGPIPGPTEGPLELLFIGRFDRQKGLDWLLDSLGEIPGDRWRLTVAGASQVERGGAVAERTGVRYTGWVTPTEVEELIDAADAVIMPSRWEGFGLVLLEAMRRGKPGLVSTRGALAEVIGFGEAGQTFSLESPASLVPLVDPANRPELQRLGARGRERFLADFTSQRMNEQTLEVYRQARARAGTGR